MVWKGWGASLACPFQWVLAFEIFIPLVLFFILLGLRQKKPTISVKEGEVLGGGPRASWVGREDSQLSLHLPRMPHVHMSEHVCPSSLCVPLPPFP